MQIHIVGGGFTLTEAARSHVDRRMRFAPGCSLLVDMFNMRCRGSGATEES